MTTLAPQTITPVPWGEFLEDFEWYQGEHLTCIGPTKSGKTTLIRELMKNASRKRTHPWQVLVATKRKDEVLDKFKPDGFIRIPSWSVSDAEVMPKVMLAPPLKSAREKEKQADEIQRALTSIYNQGGWLVYMDELKHLSKYLSLDPEIELLLHQGRSAGISVVGSVQRPRHVPLMAYDQADHLFLWRSRDRNIEKRLDELGGQVDMGLIEHGVRNLKSRHHFLYVHPDSGTIQESKVDL